MGSAKSRWGKRGKKRSPGATPVPPSPAPMGAEDSGAGDVLRMQYPRLAAAPRGVRRAYGTSAGHAPSECCVAVRHEFGQGVEHAGVYVPHCRGARGCGALRHGARWNTRARCVGSGGEARDGKRVVAVNFEGEVDEDGTVRVVAFQRTRILTVHVSPFLELLSVRRPKTALNPAWLLSLLFKPQILPIGTGINRGNGRVMQINRITQP